MASTGPRGVLNIYLNDHLAGAAAGLRLARRLAVQNQQTSWARDLSDIAQQIREDRRSLQAIRSALGIEGGAWKSVLAVGIEVVAELKMKVTGYSALCRVDELEALLAGVSSKQGLWVSLQACAPRHPTLAGFDLGELEQRAVRQIERLRAVHAEAAAMAFHDHEG